MDNAHLLIDLTVGVRRYPLIQISPKRGKIVSMASHLKRLHSMVNFKAFFFLHTKNLILSPVLDEYFLSKSINLYY